jgi:hypothetical protein
MSTKLTHPNIRDPVLCLLCTQSPDEKDEKNISDIPVYLRHTLPASGRSITTVFAKSMIGLFPKMLDDHFDEYHKHLTQEERRKIRQGLVL